jgi:DHA2 family multidrug resistance protein
LLRDRNFVVGLVLMFFVGVIMFATLALMPTMLQQSMNYPVATAGLVIAPRGIGRWSQCFWSAAYRLDRHSSANP